jgi:DNA-binding NarL/FixJ family response regulator
MLSAINDSAVVFEALQSRANGYLSKESRRAEIVDAVRSPSPDGRVHLCDPGCGRIRLVQPESDQQRQEALP